MSASPRPFNVMAKPVCGACNLACRYCYYLSKPIDLYPDVERFQMTDDVLARYTSQYVQAMPQRADFNWQGGEPLLAGIDFFRRAIALQQRHKAPGQQITNALQTNGTLVDDAWCELFAENDFLIGISIDGPRQWHDAFRVDRRGRGSFARAWAGLERLRSHGVQFNVLVTLNSANASHAGDIYRYFVKRGIEYLQFIPILERDEAGRITEFSCRAEQYERFVLEVFDIWSNRDVGRVSVRLFDNVVHTLLYGRAASCCFAERCANAYVLEFNGDLYACDHFVYPQWRIGNIMDRPLAELVADEKVEQFARLKTDLPGACRECEYLPLCHGGCPKHHVPIGTNPTRENYFCPAYKSFFARALPTLRQIAEQVRRQSPQHAEPTPAAPVQQAEASPAPVAPGRKRIGRNDPCPCGSGKKFKDCCGRT